MILIIHDKKIHLSNSILDISYSEGERLSLSSRKQSLSTLSACC